MFGRKTFSSVLKAQVMLGLFAWLLFFVGTPLQAQENRSYSYDAIDFTFRINTDTTVDVTETQTYRFVGEYHQGWRNIPKNKFDDLTDVSATDAATGQPLTYSSKRLEKTNPGSWGKYTTFYKDGEYVIEWYYDARDTTHTWILHYKLHGALGFYQDHDELYWNLFTDYTVPIGSVVADVLLPHAVENTSALQETFYVTGVSKGQYGATHSLTGFHFSASDIAPYAQLTIAPGWPKGLVDIGAYWRSWWFHNWGYVGAVILILLTPLGLLLRWYLTEHYHTGRGTIVPEYEPPQHLPPAMADIVIHEKLSPKAWSATVVDLAVRGYIRIQEKQVISPALYKILVGGIYVFFVLTLLAILSNVSSWPVRVYTIVFVVILIFLSLRKNSSSKNFSPPVTYVLEKTAPSTESAPALQDFEKAFMEALFADGEHFSFKELKRNQSVALEFSQKIKNIEMALPQETASDTHAYAVDFAVWKWLGPGLLVATSVFIGLIITFFNKGFGSFFIFFFTLVFCAAVSYLFVRYNPRLNREGQILREEWLGFELYLRTAERYRLQNLTPETFEKFLPYAIIFGVEKEWGKAFAGMALLTPSWYAGSHLSSSTFSAADFSSSFSASFSSAFASAGGGASGGGGGAGGGGGGGGGGAS